MAVLADLLRYSLGLSAWKRFQGAEWALRVNPSSGNLHPTEAYVVCGPAAGVTDHPAVFHYRADADALEQRCAFAADAWTAADAGAGAILVALTSIHWREAWKYGERAFRYCQHDLGHAIAAVSIAAALVGRRAVLLPGWSHDAVAALTGIDRDDDFFEAEREEPGCVLAVVTEHVPAGLASATAELVDAVKRGTWTGRASQLSEDHVQWTHIDEVARLTRYTPAPGNTAHHITASADRRATVSVDRPPEATPRYSRSLVLQRRSAVALDGVSRTTLETFSSMIGAVMPPSGLPFDALWWAPHVHLALFVHRVDGLAPGLYLLARTAAAVTSLKAACGRQFLWEPAHAELPLFLLAAGDCRILAQRLSCDQAIAADGFFSFGMLAECGAALDAHGPSFYRHLFWECGVVGQVMYLEAELAGARATGIGCFYDDPVHDVLGLTGHQFQSLYHFTVGVAVEDRRLQTRPGYAWEQVDEGERTRRPTQP